MRRFLLLHHRHRRQHISLDSIDNIHDLLRPLVIILLRVIRIATTLITNHHVITSVANQFLTILIVDLDRTQDHAILIR